MSWPGARVTFLSPSASPPRYWMPTWSSSSRMPVSPTTYTFLSLGKFLDSRYAAAAKEEEKTSSAVISRPRERNFLR